MGQTHLKTAEVLWRVLSGLIILILLAAGVYPYINSGHASAATITSRNLLIGSGVPSASTNYTFSFVPGTTAAIQGLEFQACTTALGTCTAPAGLSFSSAGGGTLTGTWTNATAFTVDGTGANSCIASASILCAKRTQAANESGASQRGVQFTTITNPNGTSCSSNNCTFFVRITTFSTNTYTGGSIVDLGTVASSTTQTLTINATIQEQLTFCVGASTVDDSNTTTPPLCASVSGTSLSLGTLSNANVSVSPVTNVVATGGDGNNGIAELSTNATNGSTVAYDAIQQSGTTHLGTLRVAGATCTAGNVNTDQCINAIGTGQTTVTAGTEAFGMTIAAINCKATTAYACSFTGGTYKLIRDAAYDGTGANTYPTDTGLVGGTTNAGYAWDETGTTQTIATSPSVVDKEAMILKFAATPNIVTPTGSYTAKADYVATPTY
ncbi:MAG TPA: hypothetical protein VLF79_02365 [Candidatus Saccharimonadales bacterium]|nr:hypothetical protein [Candidatus Saccharimonadales bacterium]